MKQNLAKVLQLKKQFINIKATTTEKLGFTGRGEGVAVISSCSLRYFNWKTKIKEKQK